MTIAGKMEEAQLLSSLVEFEGAQQPLSSSDGDWTQRLAMHVLRPRHRGLITLKNSDKALLHRALLALGHDANRIGHHCMALTCFEGAYQVKDDLAALLSAVNMRLKLGQINVAVAVYSHLLCASQDESRCPHAWRLTDPQKDHIRRKHDEACATAIARSRASPRVVPLEDEIYQLLQHRRGSDVLPQDGVDQLARMLRKLGHALNEAAEYDAALHLFDCAFTISRSATDLLSAANMRAKLSPGSTAAEALYVHLLSLRSDAFDGYERGLALSKLEALHESREASQREGQGDLASYVPTWLASQVLGEEERDDADNGDRMADDFDDLGDIDEPVATQTPRSRAKSTSVDWWAMPGV